MALIFMLPVDAFLYILSYLDKYDRIAFALTCQMFKQLCVNEGVFRKMDFSRRAISTMQRSQINTFFRDRQLIQCIRELNISNLRVLNWLVDDQLEEFVTSICPHLEALHIVNCGISLRRLHRILKQAPMLTALSWSLWDATTEDINFLRFSTESFDGISLMNIKHLHLEMDEPESQIQIARYLLLSCCKHLEELEIYTWKETYGIKRSLRLSHYEMIPGFPWRYDELQPLHSLVVVPVGYPPYGNSIKEFSDFVVSVLSWRSSSTKWKKLWILPSMRSLERHPTNLSLLLGSVDQDDFQSLEAVAADTDWTFNTVDEVKTFFERIGDNTVRSLHLCLPDFSNRIVEFCEPISRVGGHSLRFLHLPVHCREEISAQRNMFFHRLFSNCLNITELDLLYCKFEKDICKPLSKLKHLTKVQLLQCAISSKYRRGNEVEISKANLVTFVENCKDITHLDVRGCGRHARLTCRLTDDHLLPLSKLRKLKSLTLCDISGITEWTFLKNISEHCKFLTTLRISDWETIKDNHISVLMESAKFLEHLAIHVYETVLESEFFWDLLRHAKNLQRLCIENANPERYMEFLNVPVAVKTIKSLPRFHVLHLNSKNKIVNVEDFCDQLGKMLEEKKSDCKFSFEIVINGKFSECRMDTWINHETGYTVISNNALPLNELELCDMTPILSIPRF